MKKLPISIFDLSMIIAFVVIGLLGGGAWYYLNQQLVAAQGEATNEKSKFDQYSAYGTTDKILVSLPNEKILHNNIDLLKGQLVPLIGSKLVTKDNKLAAIEKKDPVAWKHDLDDEVRRLTALAGQHDVKLPPNFYFAFSTYINTNPPDDQTLVLSKQLLAIEQITTIMVNAPVRSITDIRRTLEESPRFGTTSTPIPGSIVGSSYSAEGGAYRGYPFEFDFETTTTGFRKVMNDLLLSPYIFVVRTLSVQNAQANSPQPSDLTAMAGSTDPSVTDKPPGEAAATVSTKGPQFLFGDQTLHVKIRVDMIDWTAPAPN